MHALSRLALGLALIVAVGCGDDDDVQPDAGVSGSGGSAGTGGTGGAGGMGGVGGTGGDAGSSGTGIDASMDAAAIDASSDDASTDVDAAVDAATNVPQCFTLRVHGTSSPTDTSAYPVAQQHYACFYWDAPWPDNAQGLSVRLLPDAHPEILRHWMLYLDENQENIQDNGAVDPACSAGHPSMPTLIAAGAPGLADHPLPNDVAIQLASANHKVLLEVHWLRAGGSVNSTSAIEVCTTPTPRPHTATLSMLGSEQIYLPATTAQTNVTGNCEPNADCGSPQTSDITIVSMQPYMRAFGTHMASTIIRQDYSRELVLDQPFSRTTPTIYDTPAVIHPGDSIETVCSYNTGGATGPTAVGYNADDEVCFNLVMAYPANALRKRLLPCVSSSLLTSAANACL